MMALFGSTATSTAGTPATRSLCVLTTSGSARQCGQDGVVGLLDAGRVVAAHDDGQAAAAAEALLGADGDVEAVGRGWLEGGVQELLGLGVQVGVRMQPDRQLGAVAGATLEGRLERLGAGVRVTRDGRLDQLDVVVGEEQVLHLLGPCEDRIGRGARRAATP